MKEDRIINVYCFKNIKFYKPDSYDKFYEMCRAKNTTVTREINAAVEKAVESGKLPSGVK